MKRKSVYAAFYSTLRSAICQCGSDLLSPSKVLDKNREAKELLYHFSIACIFFIVSFQTQATNENKLQHMSASGVLVPTFNYQKTQSKFQSDSITPPMFTDVSALYGISSQHSYRSKTISSIQETISAAVCVFDVNNDHFQDIFTIGGGGSQREFGRTAWWSINAKNKLYINTLGTGFEELDSSLFSYLDGKSLSCGGADLDNDGDIDIVVTTTDGHFLFENKLNDIVDDINEEIAKATQKELTAIELFAPAVKISGVDQNDHPIHALLTDLDGDGHIDIYSSHFIKYQRGRKTAQMSQGFDELTTNEFRAELFDSIPNKVLLNKTSLKFESSQAHAPLTSGIGRSISSQTVNINHDQFPDLLVINSFDSRSRLFIGSDAGYAEASKEFLQFSIDNMQGFAQSQLLGVNKDESEDNPEIVYMSRTSGSKNLLKHRALGNTMHWQAIAASAIDKSTSLFRSDWSALIRDFDLDNYPDIFVASGMTKTSLDSKNVMVGQNNHIYWRGNKTYSSVAEDPNFLAQSSRGAAAIDIDNDGVIELVVANNNGSVRLLKITQEPKQNWIGFSFPRQPDWLHASVQVKSAGDEHFVYQNLHPQSTFSQHDPRVVVPIKAEPPYQVIINKRDGSLLEFSIDTKNTYYVLTHSNALQAIKNQWHALEDFDYESNDAMLFDFPDVIKNLPNTISSDIDAKTQKSMIVRLSTSFQAMKRVINTDWHELQPQTQLWLWDMLILDTKNNTLMSLISGQNQKQQMIDILSLNAIRSNKEELIYEAINYQYQSENEQGLDWLLPLLSNSNQELVCNVAAVFKHYFIEEEAVFLRKQTAVPFLMEALNRPDISLPVQDCILGAIGESENQRATPQLLKMLQGDPSRQALVARTLGQLRDSRAIDTIEAIVLTQSHPLLLAEALVATERLGGSNTPERLNELRTRLDAATYWQMLAAISKSEDVVTFSAAVVTGIDAQLLSFMTSNSEEALRGVPVETVLAQIALASHRGLKPKLLSAYSKHPSRKVRLAFLLFTMQHEVLSYNDLSQEPSHLLEKLDGQAISELIEIEKTVLSKRPFLPSIFARSLLEKLLRFEYSAHPPSTEAQEVQGLLMLFSPQDKSSVLIELSDEIMNVLSKEARGKVLTQFVKGLVGTDFDWPNLLNANLENDQVYSLLTLWYSTRLSVLNKKDTQSATKKVNLTNTNSKIQLLLNRSLVSVDLENDTEKLLILMQAAALKEPEIVFGSLVELQKKLNLDELTSVIAQFPGDFLSSNNKLNTLILSLLDRAVNADKTHVIEQLMALSKGVSLHTRNTSNRSFMHVPR
jgi:hypothetical protein